VSAHTSNNTTSLYFSLRRSYTCSSLTLSLCRGKKKHEAAAAALHTCMNTFNTLFSLTRCTLTHGRCTPALSAGRCSIPRRPRTTSCTDGQRCSSAPPHPAAQRSSRPHRPSSLCAIPATVRQCHVPSVRRAGDTDHATP